MRSRLWDPSAQQDRSVLPTMGEMIGSQIGTQGAPESQQAMLARYKNEL
jgi:hypothetical protein